jgi:hypothetical protein
MVYVETNCDDMVVYDRNLRVMTHFKALKLCSSNNCRHTNVGNILWLNEEYFV